jgi:hypothetical protein
VLQAITDWLIKIGRCYGMEKDVENSKMMKFSR